MTCKKDDNSFAGATEAMLLQKAAAGDQEAFRRLTNKYRSLMYKLALKSSHDVDAAEDIVTEALIRVFRSAGTYRSEAKFSSWLGRIVENCAIDIKRKEQRHSHMTIEQAYGSAPMMEAIVEDPNWNDSYEPLFEDTEPVELIRRYLNRIDDEKRDLLSMVYGDGCQYNEIADRLALPLGTVKSKIWRAKKELQHKMGAFAA
ncbi:MAG TPA: sigma-70 family RNA polymerase sigma factor [Fimbriimonas sp.]|nr:sigma-70 family RNA polymerase sigma factor [Fimbriimonas sp.]